MNLNSRFYSIYDMKENEICIGVFDTRQEVTDFLGITNKEVVSSAISKGNKLKSRYIVKIIKE